MKYFLSLVIVILGMSCAPEIDLKQEISWLEGEWKRNFNNVSQFESWQIKESGFSGQNLFISNGDTTLMNTFDIVRQGDHWVLVKTLIKNDISSTYHLMSANSDSVVFQNPNIWPQTITYKRIDSSHVEVLIDGKDGSMRKNASFSFTKVL